MKRWQILWWVLALGLLVGPVGVGCSRKGQEAKSSMASLIHVRDISRACIMYSDEHEKTIPNSLEEVTSYLSGGTLPESPRKPKDFAGPSYIYVEALGGKKFNKLESFPHEYVAVYENPVFCADEISVGFLDGHCEKMTLAAFQRALEDTYKKLGVPILEGWP